MKQINEMSKQELLDYKKHLTQTISTKDNEQLAIKIAINSLYGSLGESNFLFFDIRMATTITLAGQLAIRWISNTFNEKLGEMLKTKDKDYVLYADTDSVAGDSVIRINGLEQSIESFYDSCQVFIKRDELNKDYVKPVDDTFTLSINPETQELESKKIKYVMKHKVKKKMFRITLNGKSVEVTADHSIIIKRDGKILNVKPTEIIKTDELIFISS